MAIECAANIVVPIPDTIRANAMYPKQLTKVVPSAGSPIVNVSDKISRSSLLSSRVGRSFVLLSISRNIAIPPIPKLMQDAIAAPATPRFRPYINTVFNRIFNTFSPTLINIGDFVSLMDRIIAEKTREDDRNTSEMLVIVKYTLAGFTISGSTPIHTGIYGDSTSAITSNNVPMVNAYSIDCPASFFSLASSPAPFAFDAIASTATAIALGIEWISQPMVVVVLTAAVAFSPRCPTIAVSTY